DGTIIPVTTWSLATVKSQLGSSLTNVKFLLMAVSSSEDPLARAWLTDANAADSPLDITRSRWTGLYSKISAVGDNATAATATNSSQLYTTNASEQTSFSYIASGGTGSAEAGATLNGQSPFPIESVTPA